MGTTWNKIRKAMSDGFQNLSDKTGEMTQIGRIKIEIIAVKRDIEKAFIELGGRVYHHWGEKNKDDLQSHQRVKKLIKNIAALEKKLNSLQTKIEHVKGHRLTKED